MFKDIIFGDLLEEKQCVTRHRENLAGVKHLNHLTPSLPLPGQPITLTLTTSGPTAYAAAQCWYTLAPAPEAGEAENWTRIELLPESVVWDEVTWDYVRRWTGVLPPPAAGAVVRYRLGARISGTETWRFADTQAHALSEATEFAVGVDRESPPAWAREAMVYHIFLDRFYPGDGQPWRQPENLAGFFGGTLRGVIQKLDYIQSLGFNTLWLSPLFASPSHHGYDATDYYTVEPRLGTNADLKELLNTAHARGLRVILDFVANHWSHLHPTFQAAVRDEHSPYHDWYTWQHWPDDYATYFDVKGLPQLNLRYGPARQYLLDCARYWLIEGVDGFRLDYANGPSPAFWTDFRRACRAARPDCWLFGEVVHTAEVQATYAGRLDGTLDFLLARALRETFALGHWPLDAFEAFLAAHEAYFAPTFSRPAFLDNHDMNRFLFLAGNDPARLKVAALALFTLSAPPIVYYGTEAGVTQTQPIHQAHQGVFEEARQPMNWGLEQNAELVEHFRRLIALRHRYPILPHGARQVVHLNAQAGTYAYLRAVNPAQFAPGDVLAAFNLSNQPRTLTVSLAGLTQAADQLNGQAVRASAGGLEIELAPLSGAFVA